MDKLSLLPHNAKKVFDGEIFDVYQWEQELFDGSTAIFEEVSRPDTVLVIPVIKNKIVINNEEQPGRGMRTDFIMGRVEEGEEADETALRELKEELGVTPKKLFHVDSDRITGKILWWSHVYIAMDVESQEKPNLDSGEDIESVRLSFDEFYKYCKNLEVTVPKMLVKLLLNEEKKDFLDRFKHPEKYFTEILI